MDLVCNPWIIHNIKRKSVYTIPFELNEKVSYSKPSYNRPVLLMFSTKKKANKFRDNVLWSMMNTSIKTDWKVDEDHDIESIAKVALDIRMYENNYVKQSFNRNEVEPIMLDDIDNDMVMLLTLCSYILYFYVDDITIMDNSLKMDGFIINPRAHIEPNDDDFLLTYTVKYLNNLYY